MTRLLALIIPAAFLPILLLIGQFGPLGALIFNLAMLPPFVVVVALIREEAEHGQGTQSSREAAL